MRRRHVSVSLCCRLEPELAVMVSTWNRVLVSVRRLMPLPSLFVGKVLVTHLADIAFKLVRAFLVAIEVPYRRECAVANLAEELFFEIMLEFLVSLKNVC